MVISMEKESFKPGNMLYPVPAVLVSVADKEGKPNVFTVAWTGTVCSDPPMVSALDVKMSVLTEEVERRMNENKSEQ